MTCSTVVRIEIQGVTVHNRIAQFRCTGHRSIFGEIALDRGNSCVFDVLRRREVRFSGAEVNYVDSLSS
jgi:hypothetical protein